MVNAMNISLRVVVKILVFVMLVFAAGLLAVGDARAFPGALQGSQASGRISLLKADRPIYIPRTTVIFNIEIENDGAAMQDYQLTVVAFGPSGDEVFRSKVERINLLGPGEKTLVQFQWGTSGRTQAGKYTLTAALRDLALYDVLFDSVEIGDGVNFEVQAKPLIFLSDDEVDFGDFLPGETPERNLFVSNTGNGVLEWSVTGVPEDWIELINPIGDVQGTETITLRVKEGAPLSRRMSGDIVIMSNGGDRDIPISGNVLGSYSAQLERIRSARGLYRQGETMTLSYTVQNDGTVPLAYGAAVTLVGPDGGIAYDSMSAGETVRLLLAAKESREFNFAWDIPRDAALGFYKAYVSLTYWFDTDVVFYDALDAAFMSRSSEPLTNAVFEIKQGPGLLVEPQEWDYGAILIDETVGSANFEISNVGGATLEWVLISWPDWIEIARPTTLRNAGGGNILARVRPSLPPGDYSGAIRLESNGGDISIPVTIRISSPATPTPVATATVEPTATPPPTATAVPQVPTDTPRPTRPAPPPPTSTPVIPTATPVPPTATPTPTATPVVLAQATIEPTPEPSGGGCGAPLGNVSLATGLVNGLLLVAPLGLVIGARYRRRRGC